MCSSLNQVLNNFFHEQDVLIWLHADIEHWVVDIDTCVFVWFSFGLPQRPPDPGSLHGSPDQDSAAGDRVRDAGRNSASRQVWETCGAGDHDRRQRGAANSHGPGYRSTHTADGEWGAEGLVIWVICRWFECPVNVYVTHNLTLTWSIKICFKWTV